MKFFCTPTTVAVSAVLAAATVSTVSSAATPQSKPLHIRKATRAQNPALFSSAIDAYAAAHSSNVGPTPRILGGSDVKMGQIPFIVLFNVVVSQTQGEQCGGSILDETHILTAAHCVFSDDGTVIKANQAFIAAGIIGNDPPESAFVQVAQVIPHENFVPANDSNQNDPNALVNDLAILKLAKPLTFSNSVQPVKIGTNPYKVGTKFTVAGWGVNNINKPKQVSQSLLETTVTSGDVSSCKQVEPDYSGPNGRQICTVDATDSSCSGDSGGPLFLQQNGVNVLAGLVSFGAQTSDSAPICGSLDTLSYYTNVYYYRDWIAQKMGVSASRLLATNSTTGTSPSSSAGSDSGSGSGSSSSSSIQSSSASFSVAAASAIFIAAATALF